MIVALYDTATILDLLSMLTCFANSISLIFKGPNAGRVSTQARDEWNNANFGWHCTIGFPLCMHPFLTSVLRHPLT